MYVFQKLLLHTCQNKFNNGRLPVNPEDYRYSAHVYIFEIMREKKKVNLRIAKTAGNLAARVSVKYSFSLLKFTVKRIFTFYLHLL